MSAEFAVIDGHLGPARVTLALGGGGVDHGVGLLETLPVVDGRPTFLSAHWQRLQDGARVLGLGEPPTLASLARDAARLIPTAGFDHRLRILLLRDGESTRCALVAGPAEVRSGRGLALGFAAAPFSGPRALARWKTTGGWLTSHLAQADGRRRGFDEVLLCGEDGVLEGARSNVFAVIGGVLMTPPVDTPMLPGIVRAVVLAEAAALGIPILERPLDASDLEAADEIGLSGSLLGLGAVTRLGSRTLGAPDILPRLALRLESREQEDRQNGMGLA